MQLNKNVKILVGVGTVWIILYPLLFIAMWFSMMAGFMFSASTESPLSMFSAFDLIFPLHCLTAVIQFILMGFYLFHIIKNTLASDVIRVILGVGIFFMPYFATPIYYYFFIWRNFPPEWALSKESKPTTNSGDNTVSDITPTQPKQSNISKKTFVIVGGIIGVIVLAIIVLGFVFIQFINNFNQTVRDRYFTEPTPVHYENLSTYQANEKALYQPVDISLFTPISTFKEIYTWSNYNQIPILVSNDDIFIAGYLKEVGDSWGSGINVDVISANINTGKVNWQAIAGSAFLLKDSQRIYAEAPNNFGAAGIVAYDINSGSLEWETRFDYEYAAGVGHLTLTETNIRAETYHHSNEATYTVDIETGEIKEVIKDTPRYAVDEVVIYHGMKFEKQGYGVPDKVTATKVDDGSIIWEYKDEPVISNIAVGGAITYVLTKNNKLIALNTDTGEILGKLAFAPRFSNDFDFINTSVLVAAEGDIVAVYYEDSKQLSVFRFTNPIK